LVHEREVSSFRGLMDEARVLDEDSGIRLDGFLDGQKCLVFVTRFGPTYTLMAYNVDGHTGTPRRRLKTVEVNTTLALASVLRSLVGRSVRAHIY
jgi:hypothetical protein